MIGGQLSIVIPLSWDPPRYRELLPECIASIEAQKEDVEVCIICDGFDPTRLPWEIQDNCFTYEIPARVGVPNAFNIGVELAQHPLVIMVGADDILHPDCVVRCLEAYERTGHQNGFYWINVQWEDSEEPYNLPCGHAMVTKKFWKDIGGYPLESPGACDAALISMIWGSEQLIAVGGEPLITVRRDTTTYTGSRDPRWTDIIIQQRELLVQLRKEKLMNMRESES